MLRVKAQHPDLDIRFVFQNANLKLNKDSKTTYGMWATKNGFKWAEGLIPQEWLDERRNEKSIEAAELLRND